MSTVPASSYSWSKNYGFFKTRHQFFGTPCIYNLILWYNQIGLPWFLNHGMFCSQGSCQQRNCSDIYYCRVLNKKHLQIFSNQFDHLLQFPEQMNLEFLISFFDTLLSDIWVKSSIHFGKIYTKCLTNQKN